MPTYPTARDLMEKLNHCSACGDTAPDDDGDGYTLCCNKRLCRGADPVLAQGPCCVAVTDRLEKEAEEGGAPLRAADVKPPPPAPAARRKAKPKKATAPTESAATRHVFRNLQKDGPHSFEPIGYRFGRDRAQFEDNAKRHLRDASNLGNRTIDGADWDAVFRYFVTEEQEAAGAAPIAARVQEPAATPAEPSAPTPVASPQEAQQDTPPPPPAPAPAAPGKARRAALGDASAPGWELLYDKPKQTCEVGRRAEDGKLVYALICKTHGHVHPIPRLTAERSLRAAGGWCPECAQ